MSLIGSNLRNQEVPTFSRAKEAPAVDLKSHTASALDSVSGRQDPEDMSMDNFYIQSKNKTLALDSFSLFVFGKNSKVR